MASLFEDVEPQVDLFEDLAGGEVGGELERMLAGEAGVFDRFAPLRGLIDEPADRGHQQRRAATLESACQTARRFAGGNDFGSAQSTGVWPGRVSDSAARASERVGFAEVLGRRGGAGSAASSISRTS